MRRLHPRALVCAFFAAFLLLGLATAGDYGVPWDEPDEMDILRANLWGYAQALHLDESAFEALAADASRPVISPLTPIGSSIERDHGIAALYPLAPVVMSQSLTGAQRSVLWHMGCWVLFTLGGFALYAVCRELGLSRGWALLGAGLLALSPRLFAQGHYNNKDVVFLSLALCVLWQGLALMRRPTLPRALSFALFGALAANAKVAGLALWGLCGVFVVVRQLVSRRMTARVWGLGGLCMAAFAALYALLTPALWGAPMAFLRYLVDNALAFQRWKNLVLFRSAVFDLSTQRLPWYYLPYTIAATTPLWLLMVIALGSAGAAWAAWRLRHEPERALPLLLTLLMWVVPLGFAVLTRTHVYNGWRHFYFVYGPMLALAAWGVCEGFRRLRGRLRAALAATLAVCVAFTGAGLAAQHPYQYAYYQPLARIRGEGFHELDYWNVSARDALLALANQDGGELRIAPSDLWTEDALTKALAVLPEGVCERVRVCGADEARYVLANPMYLQFSQAMPRGEPCVRLCAYGQPVMLVFDQQAGGG